MGGYGDTFGDRATGMADQEWVAVRDLRQLFQHMDGADLATNAARKQALQFWASIWKEAPFTRNTRFPVDGTYVAINNGDWPGKIQQMLTGLQFKELDQTRAGKERQEQGSRAQMKHTVRNTNENAIDEEAVPEEPRNAIPNDVLLSIEMAIRNMRIQLGRGNDVWSITTFERNLGLTWA